MNLKQRLSKRLTKKELSLLKSSFDVLGNIVILDIDASLKQKSKLIAQEVLDFVPSATTVLAKSGIHSGKYRTQKLKYLAGKRTKEATLRENDVTLTLDVEKVYFSVRLSTERKRIMELVKPGETILVMFSGCAPYPCVLSRNTKAKSITGIELNPVAHKYGLENVSKNKLSNITLIKGDARKAKGKYNRIIMPLPKNAEDYLSHTLKTSKKGTIIHLYTFGSEEELKQRKATIRDICKPRKIRILRTVRCGQFSPRVYRHCIDFRIA